MVFLSYSPTMARDSPSAITRKALCHVTWAGARNGIAGSPFIPVSRTNVSQHGRPSSFRMPTAWAIFSWISDDRDHMQRTR